MYTLWGYEVETLPDLLTVDEFNEITGDVFADNAGVSYAISAVSQAIRNYCGWHVSPNVECTTNITAQGSYIVLPSVLVTDVKSVTDNGVELTDYEYSRQGLVRGAKPFTSKLDGVKIIFNSGIDNDATLKNITAQIVSNAIAAPAGVSRETAGEIEIRYNELGEGMSGGISLMERDRMLLAPYKLAVVV